jgi:hypothetical protein
MAARGKHCRYGYFTGYYKLKDDESTGRIVILLGIISAWILFQTGKIKMRKKSLEW